MAVLHERQQTVLQLAAEKAKKAAPARPAQSGPSVGSGINDQEGVVFKVQIGAFKNKDLSKYLEASENFSGETDENGLKRYSLGVFRDYWEADTFKKYLREMGVKDAWIVSFKDGQRVPIKEVLENVSKS
jgi:cell division septation protein DedD